MNTGKFKKALLFSACSVFAVFMPNSAVFSEPGTLSDMPLFATNSAEPNIFFMFDDSHSMNTELLTPEYVSSWGGVMQLEADTGTKLRYLYVFNAGDNEFSNSNVIPTQAALDGIAGAPISAFASIQGAWRARNSDYNKQYYNPTTTYGPWTGQNAAGTEYKDITYYAAKTPIDPYLYDSATASTYFDITTNHSVTSTRPRSAAEGNPTSENLAFTYYPASYWVWSDDNVDGIVDATETKVKIEIKAAGTPVCASGTSATTTEQITDSCMLRIYTDEIKNFYNWFAYHRRRELTARYALSNVIGSTSGVRMGIATIHNDSTTEKQEMLSMDNDLDPATGNKGKVLEALFKMDTASSTPLVKGLVMSGQYFACSGITGATGTTDNSPFGTAGTDCAIENTNVLPATEAAGMCQQNFTIIVSDGDYTDDLATDYNSISGAIANADNDASTWSGTNHLTGDTYTFNFDKNPYASAHTQTLADIAMYYYEQDLDNSLNNKVPVQCGVDENPAQHMVTYGVGFGVTGSIDLATLPDHPKRAYTGDASCVSNVASAVAFGWTDPDDAGFTEGEGKIDDFLHATFNSRGEYLSAADPEALTTSMQSTIRSITGRSGSASSVAFNSTSLKSGSKLFFSTFNTSDWSGDLTSYTLDPNTGEISFALDDWSAATKLDDRNITGNPRDIFTYSGTDGVTFTWAAVPDSFKHVTTGDLNISASGAADGLGEQRLNFLRGDHSDEGAGDNFRVRSSRMGDVIHSTPVYVGAPGLSWPDTAPFPTTTNELYSKFKADNAARTPIVYVGANDAMLHAFDAADGEEKMAYIPEYLTSTTASEGLHYLTNPLYGHRFYVDLPPTVSDAYVKTSTSGSVGWHTILIGGSRAGGRGLFALDVTDPTLFNETAANAQSVVMWEFDNADDVDLGYSFSKPTIALSNKKSGSDNRWAAVFGNGYNATGDYKAHLFILFIDGGLDGTWTDGTDYIDIVVETDVGDPDKDTAANPNGLSTPTLVDTDGDGTVDRVYAGDLKGNMWVFDISASNTNSWSSAYKSGSILEPLFVAKDDGGNRQPITTRPRIVKNPVVTDAVGNAPNRLVLFGTGQYIVDGDKTDTSQQSYYGVWDAQTGNMTRASLLEQTATNPTATTRTLTDNAIDYAATHKGWYFDLPVSSERVITNTIIYEDYVIYFSSIPSVEPCDYGGKSWLMVHKIENGGGPTEAIFDADGDGILDTLDGLELDNMSVGTMLGDKLFKDDVANDNPVGNKPIDFIDQIGDGTGRLSWEELQL